MGHSAKIDLICKAVIYAVTLWMVLESYGIKPSLWVKYYWHLATWNVSTWTRELAISAYLSYRNETEELTNG